MGIINFEIFVVASLILVLTPGTDTIYTLSKSVSHGKKAGVFFTLGSTTGGMFHCVFAVLGLSMILSESMLAFNIVKYLGAAYLLYLGMKSFGQSSKMELAADGKKENSQNLRMYAAGITTNILNPKVALFFLAFLPQFVDQNYAQSWIPFLILGATFLILGALWCLVIAWFSSRIADKFRKNSGIKLWLDRFTGGVFIILGVKIALSDR